MNSAFPLFHWHFEISTKCALKCPRCPRTEFPGKYNITEMSLENFSKFLSPDLLKNTVKKIVLCGGQGDPIYHSKFFEIYSYVKKNNPNISIVTMTNGSYRNSHWWGQFNDLVSYGDEIIFSVDGWDQNSNSLYRKMSNWDSIINGINIMSKSKALIRWSTIIFKFNQDHLSKIQSLAQKNGADLFVLVFSNLFGSFNKIYLDKELGLDPLEPSQDFISKVKRTRREYVWLSDQNKTKVLKYKDTAHKIRAMVNKLKTNSYFKYETGVAPSCQSGVRGVYVDVNGTFYPCSWTSHPFIQNKSSINNKRIRMEESFFVLNKDKFSINSNRLEDIINPDNWNELVNGWNNLNSLFIECEKKCYTICNKK